ncbi:TetR/AcrR family transcriptional regulator [Azotobacter bryophylli]|uniref:TetR/AcrR family transcriptional regulator n=1 Tax=Azotobacter bryophylli TaxID=1986537 RepID=A0ABV7B040_9GAMM
MSIANTDEKLLKALATGLVVRPRATLKELAEAAGVSKATLHRLYGTRDNLVDMLMCHTSKVMAQIIEEADLQTAEPVVALRMLIDGHLAHRELMLFLMFMYRPDSLDWVEEGSPWKSLVDALDAFFLRGQQLGAFRVDVGAPVLTDLLGALIWGMVDSERLGRAAPARSATVLEQMFLYGATPRVV